MADNDSVILIAEDKGKKIGQIRFDINRKADIAEVDIAIIPMCRGKGYGVKLLKMGCKYAFERLHIKRVIAHIKPENEISVITFSNAGFLNCGYVDYKAQKCVEMVLENE